MKPLALFVAVVIAASLAMTAPLPGPSDCLEAAAETHHTEVFRNNSVRVLAFELSRLQNTDAHCHPFPFLTVVTTESRTTDGLVSHDWKPGDARFTYGPVTHRERNEQMAIHREIQVETMRTIPPTRFTREYDADPFGPDPGDLQPTWSVSFARGGLTAVRTQLAAGDSWDVSQPDHLLIAITDVELQKDKPDGEQISVAQGDTLLLPGGSVRRLTNVSNKRARFVTVEF